MVFFPYNPFICPRVCSENISISSYPLIKRGNLRRMSPAVSAFSTSRWVRTPHPPHLVSCCVYVGGKGVFIIIVIPRFQACFAYRRIFHGLLTVVGGGGCWPLPRWKRRGSIRWR